MSTIAGAVHFRWSDLPQDHPMDLLTRRRVIGERTMISEVTLRKGCFVPSHVHENEQITCVMSGRLRFGLGAEGSPGWSEKEVGAGEVMLLPGNVPHSALALEDTLVLDIFSPPSASTGIDRE